MDFISIASALTKHHRLLHEGDGEDDLLGAETYDYSNTQTATYAESTSANAQDFASPLLGAENLSDGSTAPLLSASAEAELLLLATNFLLCEFIVLFSILMCKLPSNV